jgi:CHAT domain-containing protein/lipopolysaccharide biosynthesis regulator YciM
MNNVVKIQADDLIHEGLDLYQNHQFSQALQALQQALEWYRSIGDREWESNTLGILGIVHYQLQDYLKAIECSQQNLVIAQELEDRWGEAQAWVNLGNAHQAKGDYGSALECHQQSLVLAQALSDKECEGKALANLGNLYQALGEYKQALESHQACLKILRSLGDRQHEGETLSNLGIAYHACGYYEQAIQCFDLSLTIAGELGNLHGITDVIANLGVAHYAAGEYERAEQYSQQHLALAKAYGDRQQEVRALNNLSNVQQALGNYSIAIAGLEQALSIAQVLGDIWSQGQILNNLGYMEFLSNNLVAAENHLFAAIELWKSQLTGLERNDAYKVSLFDIQQKSYRLLQLVLITQNTTDKIEAALEVSEQGRARALVELMTQRLSTTSSQLVMKESLSIDRIRQIARSRNATIIEYSITYSIEHKAAELEALALSEILIWVIQPSGKIYFRRNNLLSAYFGQYQSLAEMVDCCLALMTGKGRDAIPMSGTSIEEHNIFEELHQLLITPIEDLLPIDPNKHIILVPQGSLFFVPFSALRGSTNQFLIQKHTLLIAPSIQTLQLTQQQLINLPQSDLSHSLVVGNPTMPNLGTASSQLLQSLPGAEAEAREIANHLNTVVLTGSEATKTMVLQQMPNARIIHLATHALLDNQYGLGSAIALAPSDLDSGWLTAEEILQLQLQAELVVLSACNTGRGRLTGDGVIGLSRSFFASGVPSLIVSLWSVSDISTASLMIEFYQQLKQNNVDKAQALRLAMLVMINNGFKPQSWAGFVLIGEAIHL